MSRVSGLGNKKPDARYCASRKALKKIPNTIKRFVNRNLLVANTVSAGRWRVGFFMIKLSANILESAEPGHVWLSPRFHNAELVTLPTQLDPLGLLE